MACALVQSVEQLINMRFLHGLSAAAASVVINALMRDMFTKDEFSRMMSFVVLVMTIAPCSHPLSVVHCWCGLAGMLFSGPWRGGTGWCGVSGAVYPRNIAS